MAPRRGAVALLATSACTAFVLHRAAPRAACIRAAESEEESKRSKAKKLWDKLRGKDETDQRPPTRDAVRKSMSDAIDATSVFRTGSTRARTRTCTPRSRPNGSNN